MHETTSQHKVCFQRQLFRRFKLFLNTFINEKKVKVDTTTLIFTLEKGENKKQITKLMF